jgi:sugar-phosphatase
VTTWQVDAVLFDLDGTLIDSSGSVQRSWRALAEHIGRPWPEVEPHIHGVPVGQVLALLEPDMPADEVARVSEFMITTESSDTDGVVAQQGAIEALTLLAPDRAAIVTSGTVRLASARIAAAGLPRPAVVITADDVELGKPDPAPFLAGARSLGFAPGRCLVVEDATAGVTAAKAAGCPVVGVLTTHDRLDAPSVPSLDLIDFRRVDGGLLVRIPDGAG